MKNRRQEGIGAASAGCPRAAQKGCGTVRWNFEADLSQQRAKARRRDQVSDLEQSAKGRSDHLSTESRTSGVSRIFEKTA